MKAETRIKILQQAKETLAKGFCSGHYAKNLRGLPCGPHCVNCVEHDLASSLWLACEAQSELQRDALFGSIWSELMAKHGYKKSPDFCKFLDTKSQAWHLTMLAEAINPTVVIVAVPGRNKKSDAAARVAALIAEYA